MSELVSNFSLLKQTIETFRKSDDYYTVPRNHPMPFPVEYIPYGLGEAAVDTLAENGFSALDIAMSLGLKDKIVEHALCYIPDYYEILTQRHIGTTILNNYSREGAFNPN